MSLLRAKSRLRRLRSVHACGRSAVGIFSLALKRGGTSSGIATPVCALVRNDRERVCALVRNDRERACTLVRSDTSIVIPRQ